MCVDGQVAMGLLEDRPHVDHRVDVARRPACTASAATRRCRGSLHSAPMRDAGCCGWSSRIRERVDPPGAIRGGHMPELHRPRVRPGARPAPSESASRPRKPVGEMLEGRLRADQRRLVLRRGSCGEPALLHEVGLERLRIDAFAFGARRLLRRRAEHLGELAIEVDQLAWRSRAARPSTCAAAPASSCPASTAASFHPRLKVSCIDTFMPCPALALCVWQASPAMKTRGKRDAISCGRHIVELRRTAAGRSRTPTTRRCP